MQRYQGIPGQGIDDCLGDLGIVRNPVTAPRLINESVRHGLCEAYGVTSDVRTELLKPGNLALTDRHGRPFLNAVRTFVTALQRIPEGAATEYSHEQLAVVRDLAERVIAEIEDRLEDADDQPHVELELASAIYAIRRTLEDVHHWQRHFLGR